MTDTYYGFAKDVYNLGKEYLRQEPKKDPRYQTPGTTYQRQQFAEDTQKESLEQGDSQRAANYAQMERDEMASRGPKKKRVNLAAKPNAGY